MDIDFLKSPTSTPAGKLVRETAFKWTFDCQHPGNKQVFLHAHQMYICTECSVLFKNCGARFLIIVAGVS